MYKCELLKNRALLAIIGRDVLRLLQKLVTNDVANPYCYAYMLNNQGRYLCDFFVINTAKIDINLKNISQLSDNYNKQEVFIVDIDLSLVNTFIERINFYKLRSDVTIEDISQEYNVVYSQHFLKDIGDATLRSQYFSYYDPRYKKLGCRTIISDSLIKQFATILQFTEDLYRHDKYKFAIPDGANDLIVEKSIPVEYGANQLYAIDYNKGCYIGQEVIARSKYQGVIRKKIFRASSNNKSLALEDKCDIIIEDDGSKLGVICSAHHNNAIALIRTDLLKSLENIPKITAAGVAIKITEPLWYLELNKT